MTKEDWKSWFIFVAGCIAIGLLFLSVPQSASKETLNQPTLPIAKDIEYETRASIIHRIKVAARRNGIDPDTAVRIAVCESGLDPRAENGSSTAAGLFQFTEPTWEHIGSPGDRYDSVDSISAFVEWYPKMPHWWICT
jgi:soluble lytic murein transglycosylase-like protein|tara:strand:+ start:554 stop:967 length:414 start_codon:yes stop_codon:yes gene_type:complete